MQRTTNWFTGVWFRDILLVVVLFCWMYQLLTPLGLAGRIPNMAVFYSLIGLFLLIDLLFSMQSVRILLKLFAIFVWLHLHFYANANFFSLDWFQNILHEIGSVTSLLAGDRVASLSEIARTFFFLLYLWVMVIVFRNALVHRIWLIVLLLVGEVVISVIDTFFTVDASGYVVRYFLIGFVLLSLSLLPVVEKWALLPERIRIWPVKWLVWTVAVSMAAVGTGMAFPKYPAAWPDPVSYLKGTDKNVVNMPKKIGYGGDDSKLGGPYVSDSSVVFTVVANEAGYYRGESKTNYTGKGWTDVSLTDHSKQPLQTLTPSYQKTYGILPDVKSKQVEQEIHIENGQFRVIFGQYQMMSFDSLTSENPVQMQSFHPSSWRISGDLRSGQTYKAVSQVPFYDPEKIKERELSAAQVNLPDYLQLPDELPERVKSLAERITAGKTDPYEKATAIEQYLRQNYTYETENVPFPAEGQDFVDQFLFESKKGYCDHFSSSMVVLAREVGLPARWVKGFTQGELQGPVSPGSEMKKYVIRNKDAHSWAEVFIPGSGWIPFEATATFTQPTVRDAVPAEAQADQPKQAETPDAKQADNGVNLVQKVGGSLVAWGAAALLVGLLFVVAYRFRNQLIALWVKRGLEQEHSEVSSAVVTAVGRLLRVLQRSGLRRNPDFTVREFGAEKIGNGTLGAEWISLVRIFERVRYGNKRIRKEEASQFQELWERIVRFIGRTKKD
ncbi:DUF4129 domain-containing transglutaminase family protein [Effusibacillus dendaii]|uniref:Transglutaminase-like domain-containing protein n=1 Tax=Effusibacillus dendaii TaxID=2743772 RepID=A0A7I8DE96_9BACL|nr:transglutaminase domain-containing protein [Effusibacillus dendaii]BCJ87166.1 hypothetical protein skT53_21510 [Effusibacillus dendaii]